MGRLSTVVAAAFVVSLVVPGTPASGQSSTARPAEPEMGPLARAGAGSIRGLVLDAHGLPLVGAMVSALGPTAAFALTDAGGRFTLRALPSGPYTVRVHLDGYLPSRRQMVEVRSAAPAMLSVALQVLQPNGSLEGRPVLAAGVLPVDFVSLPGAAAAGEAETSDNHSETAWRLRHLTRSVLKSTDATIVADAESPSEPAAPGSFLGRAADASSPLATALFDAFPFSGQVNFITTGSFDTASQLLTPGAFASRSVAYVALGAPVGRYGDWVVRGAFTQGDTASWFVAGSLAARQSARHRYAAGVSYSAQHLERSDPLAFASVTGGARSVGSAYGYDEWTLSRRVSVAYGLNYAWYDYMPDAGLISPRVAVTLSPIDHLRIRTAFARHETAPGAEEFLAASTGGQGLWLPPERSFSTLSGRDPFRAESTNHFAVAVERDVDAYVVGFRAFYQRVEDQAASLFAASPGAPVRGIGHYYVANVGDVETSGWAVSLSRPIAGPVRGSVDYALTTARWRPTVDESVIALWGAPLRRPESERFHDVTTSVETDIAQTATRVFVVYRFNSAFARQVDLNGGSGFDTRFDVQVSQSLPFLNFTSADWEVLVAVRNMFHQTDPERSVYDELLVIRPPKRIVGGVRVRF